MISTFKNPIKLSYNTSAPVLFKKVPIRTNKPFMLPFGNTYFTIVIVISYLLTRMTYEKNKVIEKNTKELIKKTGLNKILKKSNESPDTRIFKMNNHYKRVDKKISDIFFLYLLSFFVFKMKWNNIEDSSSVNKLAWSSSVIIAPLVINLFLENKNNLNIDSDNVSNVDELKKSNIETQVFLSIALMLTFGVGIKLAHRIYTCKGGMNKPIIIQIIIIGTALGMYFLSEHDIKEHNNITEDTIMSETGRGGEDNKNNILKKKSLKQHGWVIVFLLILSFTICKKDTIDYIIEGSLWGYLIQNIARWDDISPNLM